MTLATWHIVLVKYFAQWIIWVIIDLSNPQCIWAHLQRVILVFNIYLLSWSYSFWSLNSLLVINWWLVTLIIELASLVSLAQSMNSSSRLIHLFWNRHSLHIWRLCHWLRLIFLNSCTASKAPNTIFDRFCLLFGLLTSC